MNGIFNNDYPFKNVTTISSCSVC